MSIFNEYVDENIVSIEYDPVTGIEFESIDTSSLTELCIDLRETCTYLNSKLYVVEVMENLGLTEPLKEGVASATKDFFNAIVAKIKTFLTMVKDFFGNIFKKMELMFTVNGDTFLKKYGEGIIKSTKDNPEWIEYNERYVLTKSDHEDIFNNIDKAINKSKNDFNNIQKKVLAIANRQSKYSYNKDENGKVDEEKVEKSVNDKMGKEFSSEELSSDFSISEKEIASSLYTGAESFSDVRDKFKEATSEKDKDTTKVLDKATTLNILRYCLKHVRSDIVDLKNTQTNMVSLINNTQNSINALNNKFGNTTDEEGNIGPVRKACNYYMSVLSFLQELNSKRVSTRTQTFNYYISVLKRYTKKNYNLIVGAPSKEKKEDKK